MDFHLIHYPVKVNVYDMNVIEEHLLVLSICGRLS